MRRHWISCIGSTDASNDCLRPEIVRTNYSWLHAATQRSIDAGLQPLWHCPLGLNRGDAMPSSCGPLLGPRFSMLWRACFGLTTYALKPHFFTGMRFHDPHTLAVPQTARWMDCASATDRSVVDANMAAWFKAGVSRWVIDNSAANPQALMGLKKYVKTAYGVLVDAEGLLFNADGTVSNALPSVHTDIVMYKSHPDLKNNAERTGRVVVVKGPLQTTYDVVASMNNWAERGFRIEYLGDLLPEVLKVWSKLEPNDAI